MRAFRRFQQVLPMPNRAIYRVEQMASGQRSLQGLEAIMRVVAAIAS